MVSFHLTVKFDICLGEVILSLNEIKGLDILALLRQVSLASCLTSLLFRLREVNQVLLEVKVISLGLSGFF